MPTITGARVVNGTRARFGSRWFTVVSDPEVVVLGGRPYERMRQAKARDSKGREDWLCWLTDDVLPLPGVRISAAISVTDYDSRGESGEWLVRTYEIIYRRREWGGWKVCLLNGRCIGWLCPSNDDKGRPGWEGRIEPSAFRGAGPDDQGNVLDEVPDDLYGASSGPHGGCRAVAWGRDRDEATREILRKLVGRRAPAVGFGAHYRVRPWADR
jgi:hypothetical protein